MGDLRAIKRRVGSLLGELGRSPDEVADSLRRAGVQGVPRSNASCAVAVYATALLRADPRIRSVAVGPCTLVLTLTRDDGIRPGGRLVVQLPKAVRGFVHDFDAQAYPEVVRGVRPETVVLTGPGSTATAVIAPEPVLGMRTVITSDGEPKQEPAPAPAG